jgi:hypothetical protein
VSRSRKKRPIVKISGRERSKKAKRRANKKVRQYIKRYFDALPLVGSWHRKVYQSWHIYDGVLYCSKNDFWTDDENLWEKYYIRK